MSVFMLIERVRNKIKYQYRKRIFKEKTRCKHNDFSIVGDITLINRNVKIGRNVAIYPDVMFFGDGLIDIGDNSEIGNGTIIYSSKDGGVTIGNDTLIAGQCYIIDTDHGIGADELIRCQHNSVAPITIGNDCWIAAGCKDKVITLKLEGDEGRNKNIANATQNALQLLRKLFQNEENEQ